MSSLVKEILHGFLAIPNNKNCTTVNDYPLVLMIHNLWGTNKLAHENPSNLDYPLTIRFLQRQVIMLTNERNDLLRRIGPECTPCWIQQKQLEKIGIIFPDE